MNGHSFIERELLRENVRFRKDDNAFLAAGDPEALQAAADRLSAAIIRKRLDYWTLLLGPKFSKKDRDAINLSRHYSVQQVEYCRNLIFRRYSPIHKLFERYDHDPSLVVKPAKNLWHRMGKCQTGGDAFARVQKTEGVSFRNAYELLSSRFFVASTADALIPRTGATCRSSGVRSRWRWMTTSFARRTSITAMRN